MSRDFELLQKLEKGWSRSFNLLEPAADLRSQANQKRSAEITQPLAQGAVRPGGSLTPDVRNELTKVIVRTSLSGREIRTVLFTGIAANQSAKWVAACVADLLGDATRERVCLLDADLAVPTVHLAYSIPNRDGLAGVLRGACAIEDCALRVSSNIWVVPAGIHERKLPIGPSAFQGVIADLLEHFEHVIISAPDCDRLVELSVVSAATDGAVLVLDAMNTRRIQAQEAKAALDIAKVRILGSVYIQQISPIPGFFRERL